MPKWLSQIEWEEIKIIPFLPYLIPLILLPLAAGWWFRSAFPVLFEANREDIFFGYLIYIFIVRFALLDMMLFYVSTKHRSAQLSLLHIVALYLEVTAITLLYFALLYNMFGVFDLFQYNGVDAEAHLASMKGHEMRLALYISVELFTTLGLGDWIPKTLNAMFASGIESLLGFIQGGVFFAVLIYAHQRDKVK